ncbi:DNA mismatch repair protein MutS [Saccharibacter sp. 17.LH.SD]|uniref:DNA mismatch repair protein MutS n=1 Tax=Saccharibacter sp. 17.LH.SD TaxID=2689393 RepID=UPI00136D3F15|nr:DNA mismatch repair protein MutS [Saccharibacter sp. 17.LH.SD]MXV44142.1 DNA mismatch repair protein MutS [Saccharibacter sp. 17.LH.SD]
MPKISASPALPSSADKATPTMAQWFSLKSQEPDALLFFRMGDFYELFFGDAETAAIALDITLTHRGIHEEKPIPMCGVPVGTAQVYLSRLIRRGFRVAVAEQTETPKKGQKGPLRRDIVRVITPGTLTEDELLDAGRANILLAISTPPGRRKTPLGAAWIDISTGSVETLSQPNTTLLELLARLDPSEILADPTLIPSEYHERVTPSTARPSLQQASSTISEAYGVAQLDALGDFPEEQISACAILLNYVRRSQAGRLPRLSPPIPQGLGNIMGFDPATRYSLDIIRSRDGGTKHTLFKSVNHTQTAAGTRLLARWLSTPVTDLSLIQNRQEGWSWLHHHHDLTASLRQILKQTPDCSRSLGRISSGRPLPRDLAAVRDTLRSANAITEALHPLRNSAIPGMIRSIGATLYGRADTLLERLESGLSPELPAKIEDGGVIATGFDTELDTLRDLRDDSRRTLAQLQVRLSEQYGVNNLRIRHHNQLGYVIEVPSSTGAKLRQHQELYLRQGTATLTRFSNDELISLNQAILTASEKTSLLERHLFNDLAKHILETPALDEIAVALAELDVLVSCALLMSKGSWCRPFVNDSQAFNIRSGRHPVVEASMNQQGSTETRFIPNHCALPPEKHVMLLTGPNMAGKSTFLRQTALIVILAQAGLPVSAEEAEIGIVDRLFSRVGAADDLARGRSTFMVEMTETASILNQAGPRSLVVVDEIGRGTSTLDGLAIAWATLEALHSQLGSRTIFATHFHELGSLLTQLPKLAAYTMAVQEWDGNVIFQHEVKPGMAHKSWGLHVARLAGIPSFVVKRAKTLLTRLEAGQVNLDKPDTPPSLPLFEAPSPKAASREETNTPSRNETLEEALRDLDPDSMSPREAHTTLYHLKDLIR